MTTLTQSGDRGVTHAGSPAPNWEPVKAFAVFLVIQIALVLGDVTPFFDGSLADPDAYMRLNRVQHLWDSGAWFDPVYPRIGPPDGHVQHWTRPMDLLLLVGAAIAAPFVGFEAGLHWWGVAIGPVMLLPALMAVVWAARPLVRREWLWLVGVLFVTQPAVLITFLVGRPDHNCLLILLFVVYVGLTIRLTMDPRQSRLAVAAGAVAALSLWVSMETLLFVVAGIAAPGLIWILGDRQVPRMMTIHAGSLFAVLAATLMLERGFGRFTAIEFDQTSVAHLGLFGLNLGFWTATDLLRRRFAMLADWQARLALSGVLAAGVLAVLWIVLPGFFESPLARVDDLYRSVRLVNIEEIQPILRWSDLFGGDTLTALGRLFLWIGAAAFAIPYIIWMVATRTGTERCGWIALAAIAAIFVPLSCMQIRWVAYAEAVLMIPYAGAVGFALDRVNRSSMPAPLLAVPRAVLVSLACVWTFGPAALAGAMVPEDEARGVAAAAGGSCPLAPVSAFLADPGGLGDHPRRLMAFVDFGPELLHRTPHAVYSIPNHRFQPGFTATYRIMTASGAGEARSLIRQSRVEFILVCPDWPVEPQFYGGEAGNSGGFYTVLASGRVPDYLQPVRLPEDVGRHFRLYEVVEPR